MLNLAGEVIGINTAIIRGSIGNNQEAEGIGFAISMTTAIPVSTQLIANGTVTRPKIGVQILDVTPALAAELGLSTDKGVLIVAVDADGPAEKAGMRERDIIVRVGSTQVASSSDLVRLFLTSYLVGDTVPITVVRGEVELTLDVTLAEL